METEETGPRRKYVGMIWVEEEPGIRLQLVATSLDEARAQVVEQYGEGHVISLWHEGDASSAR